MSRTTTTRVGKILGGTIAAAAVALPLALVATPAEAAVANGCSVTPLRPTVVGKVGATKVVRYSVSIFCVKDRILQVRQQRFESDAPLGIAGDQFQGSATFNKTFAANQAVTFSSVRLLSNTELGNEEVYHRTSFRVATINGVSGWTAFQSSPILSVAN